MSVLVDHYTNAFWSIPPPPAPTKRAPLINPNPAAWNTCHCARLHYLFFFEGQLLGERGHLLVGLGHVEGGEGGGLGGHLLHAPLHIITLSLLALQA